MSIPSPRAFRGAFSVMTTVGVLALGLTGCAKHPSSDTATHLVTVQVNNNFPDVTSLDIWLREGTDPGANRRELGTAPGNQTVSFTFTPSMFGQQYVLEGDPPTGNPIKSRPFSVDNEGITMVKWTLDHNVVTYFGQ